MRKLNGLPFPKEGRRISRGLEMSSIEEFIERDLFAKDLGIEIMEYGEGRAKARLAIRERHLNSAGTVHGGAIFALADAVFSVASNSHGALAMGIQACISYFKSAGIGVLYADASEVALNPKLATYLIEVHDENHTIIALFQGTVYRKTSRIGLQGS